uniref:Rhodanese domain-containing protein n=1 Tax=Physcomitrium patens TaxID=3218 RepID=A0A2K1KJ47_PHYPA|nr:uncharacterized protein LOC112282921 isoform X4 [Physcomitrium patens]PNR53804.1 hypothetical protein PHYPA_007479 [Physcomitrium patens]|eukprot:XP_024376876.1 uncharacterized protein LOC112282921 isoform X4 [Physcomitrella patens]
MAQSLFLVSSAAASCRGAAHLVYTPLLKGNASTANASVLLRSKFILGRKPLFKFDSVSLPRGGSGRRSRLLAIAEIDYAVIGAEQQLIDSATISTSPVGSEIEGTGTELNVPEPIVSSVDATAPQTLPAESAPASIVESAGTDVPDVIKAAGESVDNPGELTPLQRYEAMINRGNGGGGARKPIAVEDDANSFSFPDSIEAAQESVAKTLTDVQDAINDSVGSAGKAIRDAYESLNGSIKGSVNSVTGLYDRTVDGIQTSVDSTVKKAGGEAAGLTSVFRTGTPLNNQLKEVVVVVKGALGTTLETTRDFLINVYGSIKVNNLSPEVQSTLSETEQKLKEIADPVGSFLQQAYDALENVERALGVDPENPIIPVILILGGTLYLGVSFWQGRYGGYSGDLLPVSAIDLLKKERNVVLVDIRPQELRESEGIPDLRRGMRTRFATVEAIQVDGPFRKSVRNSKEIDNILTAAVIRNLKTVQPSTKVIVMDTDGSQSKEIARALRRFGVRRRYRVEGGYKAWSAAGLRTKLEGTDTPISILKEDAEEIVEEVKPTPDGIVLVALGTVAGIYAVLEWEKALQLLGVIGIGQAIYTRANSYESLEDAKADLRLLQKPFKSIGDRILWLVGQVQPATLQLATAPSTLAVQDRVLQAAAKHGPLASELSEQDESGSEVDVETSPETPAPLSAEETGAGESLPPAGESSPPAGESSPPAEKSSPPAASE